jgi:tetratricopeptide (TPR) repeat protein
VRKALLILAVLFAFAVSAAGSVSAVRLYLARRAYQTSLDEYNEALEKKKPFSDATVRRLERSIQYAPGDPDPHFLLSRIRARTGEPEGAREHMAECVRVFPLNGRAHFYLGFAHFYLGKREAAQVSMETAAALAGNHPDLQFRVGYYFWSRWEDMGRVTQLEKAFRYFRAAAERDGAYLNKVLLIPTATGVPDTIWGIAGARGSRR